MLSLGQRGSSATGGQLKGSGRAGRVEAGGGLCMLLPGIHSRVDITRKGGGGGSDHQGE